MSTQESTLALFPHDVRGRLATVAGFHDLDVVGLRLVHTDGLPGARSEHALGGAATEPSAKKFDKTDDQDPSSLVLLAQDRTLTSPSS